MSFWISYAVSELHHPANGGNSRLAQSFRLHLLHHMSALGSPAEMWRSAPSARVLPTASFPASPPPDQFSSPAVFRKTKGLAE